MLLEELGIRRVQATASQKVLQFVFFFCLMLGVDRLARYFRIFSQQSLMDSVSVAAFSALFFVLLAFKSNKGRADVG